MPKEITLSGVRCTAPEPDAEGMLLLWPCHPHEGNEPQRMRDALEQLGAPVILAAFEITDWDRQLSPWRAPAAFGAEELGGEGEKTLDWLTREYLPYLRQRCPHSTDAVIMGYSLAGLFALWALYETPALQGAVCCSGSLWIEGWEAYADAHPLPAGRAVYLSLGGREEKTRNPIMASVGDRTRAQEKRLKLAQPPVRCALEWNPGGHFADPVGRLIKGVRWMLRAREG